MTCKSLGIDYGVIIIDKRSTCYILNI